MTFTTKGKAYFDNGVPIPSVTTILQQWPKQLTKWAAETTAGYAVDHWDELEQLPPSQRQRVLEKQVWASRDAAALRGTQIHAAGELLAGGLPVDVAPEHLGPVEAYARFLDQRHLTPLVMERPILNRRWGYAGRPDLLARIDGRDDTWLLDIKTGKNIYESHALQLAAYAHAETFLHDDGNERPWLHPDRCGVLHVGTDFVNLLPVDVNERTLRTFLYTFEAWKWAQDCSQAYKEGTPWPVGRPLDPPRLEAVK